jgi:uncharacterized protein YdeI (YjbR/CyaY-like superfamily)
MGKKDARVDAYIGKSAEFARPILIYLRDLIHDTCPTVEETIKWGFPHFMYNKGILCSMAAFKQHCAFGFWDQMTSGSEESDGKAKDGMGQFGRITSLSDLPKSTVLARQIREAMKRRDAGVKPRPRPKAKEKEELVIPDYFTAALKKNKKALATFDQFSYTNKKEYVYWITEAKTEETRKKRLQTAIEWMSEGKIRMWKYARK